MGETKVAKRYAKALFKLKSGAGEAHKVLEVLEAASELFQDKSIRRILVSPAIPANVKQAVLDYAVQKAGGSQEDKQFFHTIVAARRVEVVPQIARAFRELLNEVEGVVEATVTSVAPLTQDDLSALSTFLEKVENRKVRLSQEIDKSILGGLVVNVGNSRLDLSLRSKLESIAQSAAR